MRSKLRMLRLLAADWHCYFYHHHWHEDDGYRLCDCGREWRKQLLRSRAWQAEMSMLAQEMQEGEFGSSSALY